MESKENNRIIVIGGGPAGLMAAGQAALSGCNVTLLERMATPARKLLISGKGRCNLTNTAPIDDFIDNFNRSGRFLRQVFSVFFTHELQEFFEQLGIELECQRGGRIFPRSGRSADVVNGLLRWCRDAGVTMKNNCRVEHLEFHDNRIAGVRLAEGKSIGCHSVILATGGTSYPETGSTGDGFTMAKALGHRIIAPKPALVPLITREDVTQLAGLDLKNIGVRVFIAGKRKINDFGEISFNRTGIGGSVILSYSKKIVEWLEAGKRVEVALDLKPALNEQKLDNRLQRDLQKRSDEKLASVLRGLLPKQLVPYCLDTTQMSGGLVASDVSGQKRRHLVTWLKNMRLTITGHRPLAEGMVTSGGVCVKEINPLTMESLLINGLFFAGELIDVDGDTGGFNLQAAFSTGWVAGRSAAAMHRHSL